LDLNFGNAGKVTKLVGTSPAIINSLTLDVLGNIIFAGTCITGGKNNLFVGRYSANGVLDTTFGAGGITTLTNNNGYSGNSVKIDQNGKIFVCGFHAPNNSQTNFLITRFLPGGSVDTTFAPHGAISTQVLNYTGSAINSIVIDSLNRIVVAGYAGTFNGNGNFTLARYNNNGTLDTSFGTNVNGFQVTILGNNSKANSILIDLNGQIVAGGFSDNQNMITRYNINGSLDMSFGIGGIFTNQIGNSSQINSITVQSSDNRIISGGFEIDPISGQTQVVLIRYNKNNSDFININSITAYSTINTKIPIISGISSAPNATVQAYVNGTLFKTIATDGFGSWDAGNTNVLPIGSNVVQVNLISNNNIIVAEKINFNVIDNLAEDSIFAYGTQAQTSTSSLYSSIPFNNLVRLGTWSYSNSEFACNEAGTYLIEYSANAGLTGTVSGGTTSVDVATTIAIDDIEYLGSEDDAAIDLSSNFTRKLTRSFIKKLELGQMISLKFAVNIQGGVTGFNAGLMISSNAIGNQPVYSLTITRIG